MVMKQWKGEPKVMARRLIVRMSVAGLVVASQTGVVMADSVQLGTTGPDATQSVSITNQDSTTMNNTNAVSVTNASFQQAVTGSVTTDANTTTAGSGSGDATNTGSQSTTVGVHNDGGGLGQGSVSETSSIAQTGQVETSTTVVQASTQTGGRGSASQQGDVLGAQTVGGRGGSALPEVGASVPMDVSGLRALYQPKAASTGVNLVKAQGYGSAWWAALIAILAGGFSFLYGRREWALARLRSIRSNK